MLNVSKRTAYIILAISIVIEIIGDAMLTACHGYENKLLGIGAVVTILFSFFLFSKVLHIIDLPIAYATWSVTGALVCTLLGVFFFHQHLSPIGWVSMIVLAAYGLHALIGRFPRGKKAISIAVAAAMAVNGGNLYHEHVGDAVRERREYK